MSNGSTYELWIGSDFDLDYRRIDAAAIKDPQGPAAELRRRIVREMVDLAKGRIDGHHALGYEAGKGDLRDCVVSYVQSDPQKKADHRLVFREIGPEAEGRPVRRELLAIRPRHGSGNVYEHMCARLNRHPDYQHPGLDRFGRRAPESGGNEARRRAELETRRAIAHAWSGQQPLASSRPLDANALGGRARVPHAAENQRVQAPDRDR